MKARLIPFRRTEEDPARWSDQALLAACVAGDPAAGGALFDRFRDTVYRFVASLAVTNEDDLDDLVQMTFLEVIRSAGRFRGGSAVSSWIMGIAVNVVRHHVRGEARRCVALDRFALSTPSRPSGPESQVAHTRQLARLRRAIDGLPLDLRAAYVMCAIEEVPGPEAARALGVREGTLWRRLHDARKRLRRAMEGEQS